MDEKLQAVLKYAGNDQDRARKIMSGELKDIRVVNGMFSVESVDLYCQFQLFFSIDAKSLQNITLALFNDISLNSKTKVNDAWKLFHTNLRHVMESESISDSRDFISHFAESVEGYQMADDVMDNDTDSVEMTVEEIVKKSYIVDDIECHVAIDEMSTLDMVENDISIGKVPKKIDVSSSSDDDKSDLEKQAQYTVDSSLLIAPVSGKNISDVVPGDLLKVVMNAKNEVTRKIAGALKAVDENGNFLPVKGRVKEITPLPKGGYRIYCLIAKGILAKIIEEENIKAELFVPEDELKGKDNPEKSQTRILVYGALIAVVLVLAVVLIMLVL